MLVRAGSVSDGQAGPSLTLPARATGPWNLHEALGKLTWFRGRGLAYNPRPLGLPGRETAYLGARPCWPLVPKLCLGTHFRETLFRAPRRTRNRVSRTALPNRVWQRGKKLSLSIS